MAKKDIWFNCWCTFILQLIVKDGVENHAGNEFLLMLRYIVKF